MAQDRNDPLADLFTLFAAPLSGTVRSLEQFRKGVDEFLKGVENFNRAMANLNETSERINTLLADVEEPIRAAIPQVTRTVKAADEMMQVVSGPAMAVAPGLNRLAETLSTPAFDQLPHQLGQFADVLGEVSRRLGPLTQLAESAGGIFGGFRVPGTRTSHPTAPPDPEPSHRSIVATVHAPAAPEPSPARAPAARKKPAAKRSPAKKSPPEAAKKSPAEEDPTAKKRASDPLTTASSQRRRCPGHALTPNRSGGGASAGDERGGDDGPGEFLPRTSIVTGVSTAVSGGRNASAMPWPSTGEKLPLVTTPTARPSCITVHSARAGRRPSVAIPMSRRVTPRSRSAMAACFPVNSGLSHATTHPRPAWSEVIPGPQFVAVERERRLETQGVAGTEACRGDTCCRQRPPERSSSARRHRDLESGLAGVAGSGDDAGHRVPRARGHTEPPDRGRRGEDARDELPSIGTLNGNDGTIGGRVDTADGSEDPARVRGVRHDVEHVAGTGMPPHDDVVDDRGVVLRRGGACTEHDQVRSCGGRWSGSVAGVRTPRDRRPAPFRGATRRTSPPDDGRRDVPRSFRTGRRSASPSRRTPPSWHRALGARRRAASAAGSSGGAMSVEFRRCRRRGCLRHGSQVGLQFVTYATE